MRLKPFDIPAVALAIAAAAFSAFFVYGMQTGSARIIVEGGGKSWVFPVDAEETLHVHGELGDTVVSIHGGEVAITKSPCPNQTCVAAGPIDSGGQWVACLPNAVFVRIEGKVRDQEADVIVR